MNTLHPLRSRSPVFFLHHVEVLSENVPLDQWLKYTSFERHELAAQCAERLRRQGHVARVRPVAC